MIHGIKVENKHGDACSSRAVHRARVWSPIRGVSLPFVGCPVQQTKNLNTIYDQSFNVRRQNETFSHLAVSAQAFLKQRDNASCASWTYPTTCVRRRKIFGRGNRKKNNANSNTDGHIICTYNLYSSVSFKKTHTKTKHRNSDNNSISSKQRYHHQSLRPTATTTKLPLSWPARPRASRHASDDTTSPKLLAFPEAQTRKLFTAHV